jgi:carbamoyl-phosphate synthase small subunit
VIAIDDVDTRALVAHVRMQGAMNCIISSDIDDLEILKEQLAKVPSMDGLELASIVSTKEPYYLGDPEVKYGYRFWIAVLKGIF